jgi:hypothetical protein
MKKHPGMIFRVTMPFGATADGAARVCRRDGEAVRLFTAAAMTGPTAIPPSLRPPPSCAPSHSSWTARQWSPARMGSPCSMRSIGGAGPPIPSDLLEGIVSKRPNAPYRSRPLQPPADGPSASPAGEAAADTCPQPGSEIATVRSPLIGPSVEQEDARLYRIDRTFGERPRGSKIVRAASRRRVSNRPRQPR